MIGRDDGSRIRKHSHYHYLGLAWFGEWTWKGDSTIPTSKLLLIHVTDLIFDFMRQIRHSFIRIIISSQRFIYIPIC